MMRQFRGTPFERDLRQAIKKLSELLPDEVSVNLDAIASFLSVVPTVQAEYDPESFCAVLQAVLGRHRLENGLLDSRAGTRQRAASSIPTSSRRRRRLVCVRVIAMRAGEVRMFAVQRVGSIGAGDGRNVRPPRRLLGFSPPTHTRKPPRHAAEDDFDVILGFGSPSETHLSFCFHCFRHPGNRDKRDKRN